MGQKLSNHQVSDPSTSDSSREDEERKRRQPGGLPPPPGFIQMINENEDERKEQRIKVFDQFQELENLNQFWDSFIQLRRLRRKTNDGCYFFSEWCFYLRFFFMETGSVFSVPEPGSEYFDTWMIYQEVANTRKDSWKMFIESRISDITVCSHLADMLTEKIYFPSKSHAEASIVVQDDTDPIGRIPEMIDMITSGGESYLIRVEINDNHVYVYDIPKSSDGQIVYRIESMVGIFDSHVQALSWNQFIKELQFKKHHLDLLKIYPYDEELTFQRITSTLQLWNKKTLENKLDYYTKKTRWTTILDLTYRLNEASTTLGIGTWKKLTPYL